RPAPAAHRDKARWVPRAARALPVSEAAASVPAEPSPSGSEPRTGRPRAIEATRRPKNASDTISCDESLNWHLDQLILVRAVRHLNEGYYRSWTGKPLVYGRRRGFS